jgi:hypothetical protein
MNFFDFFFYSMTFSLTYMYKLRRSMTFLISLNERKSYGKSLSSITDPSVTLFLFLSPLNPINKLFLISYPAYTLNVYMKESKK